jgi:hypothetical protein
METSIIVLTKERSFMLSNLRVQRIKVKLFLYCFYTFFILYYIFPL